MALLRTVVSTDRIYVAAAFGKQIVLGHRQINRSNNLGQLDATPSDFSNVDVSSKTLESSLKCLQFSNNGQYLVVCGEDKKMTLFSTKYFSIIESRILPKRASSFWFTEGNDVLLVADKSGEVSRYTLPELKDVSHSLLLGHSSIILDMLMLYHQITNQRFIATCDRDEKIRISHYPNGYNIHCYCLHHTSFVSSLCKIDQFPKYLVTGGGDGLICVWDWYNGLMLSSVNVDNDKNDKCDPCVVTALCQVSTHSEGNSVLIAVATNEHSGVLIYSLDNSGVLSSTGLSISLSCPLWSMDYEPQSGRLWVCLNDKDTPMMCYKFTRNQITEVTALEEPLLSAFNKMNIAEGAHGLETNWSELRKRDFDNMSIYLKMKEERIQLKMSGYEMDTELNRISETEVHVDDNPKQSKIIKLDESEI